jgi:hypothetical protein
MSFTRKQQRVMSYLRGLVHGYEIDNKIVEDLRSANARLTIHDCNVLLRITNKKLVAVKEEKERLCHYFESCDLEGVSPELEYPNWESYDKRISNLRACVNQLADFRNELIKNDRDRYLKLSAWSRFFDCCRQDSDDQIRDAYDDLVDRANRKFIYK